MEFLSLEWLLALDAALASTTVDPAASLVIEQTVTGPSEDVIWHVVLADGRVRVTPGPAEHPDVRLRSDARTAAAVACGRRSAQRGFLEGTIRLEGDVAALRRARTTLDALDDAFASVRALTAGLD